MFGRKSHNTGFFFLYHYYYSVVFKLQPFATTKQTNVTFSLEGEYAVSLASAVSLCVCTAHKPFPVSTCQADQRAEPTV